MHKNPGIPAFPVAADFGAGDRQMNEGMSMRQYYKGKALQGELAAQSEKSGFYQSYRDFANLAERIGRIADAMIAEDEESMK